LAGPPPASPPPRPSTPRSATTTPARYHSCPPPPPATPRPVRHCGFLLLRQVPWWFGCRASIRHQVYRMRGLARQLTLHQVCCGPLRRADLTPPLPPLPSAVSPLLHVHRRAALPPPPHHPPLLFAFGFFMWRGCSGVFVFVWVFLTFFCFFSDRAPFRRGHCTYKCPRKSLGINSLSTILPKPPIRR